MEGGRNKLVSSLARCLSIWYPELMDVGEEKRTCGVGLLSATPGKVADEGHPLLEGAEMYSWTQGGNTEGTLSYGMITWLTSLEGQEN